jgi:hypothetical protein
MYLFSFMIELLLLLILCKNLEWNAKGVWIVMWNMQMYKKSPYALVLRLFISSNLHSMDPADLVAHHHGRHRAWWVDTSFCDTFHSNCGVKETKASVMAAHNSSVTTVPYEVLLQVTKHGWMWYSKFGQLFSESSTHWYIGYWWTTPGTIFRISIWKGVLCLW